jgi:single-strand DNA-binding protein
MINQFAGIGNLGTAPMLKTVTVNEQPRMVADFRVYFDRRVGEAFEDKGGFWTRVDLWGFRAQEAAKLLQKGARVFFIGSLRQDTWIDEASGEPRTELRLSADHFFLDSIGIETVQYREKGQTAKADMTQTESETPIPEDNPA